MNPFFHRVLRTSLAMLFVSALPLAGQDVPAEAAMSELLRESARESAAQLSSQSAVLRIAPEHAPVLVTQVFAEELQKRGISVRTSPTEGADILRVDIREMRFSTAPGPNSSYLRSLSLVLGVLISNEGESTHRWSKEFRTSRSDTLSSSPSETKHDWLAQGPGFWTSVLEPAMLVAAGAIILVLLFTVRGSS